MTGSEYESNNSKCLFSKNEINIIDVDTERAYNRKQRYNEGLKDELVL
jgi:hypothetical protein